MIFFIISLIRQQRGRVYLYNNLCIRGFNVDFNTVTGHITTGSFVGRRKPVQTLGVSRFL